MDEHHSPVDRPAPRSNPKAPSAGSAESMAWAAIGTLVAGPATWGGIGWLADRWLGTDPVFTAIGVMVGFATSVYIVYVRFGR